MQPSARWVVRDVARAELATPRPGARVPQNHGHARSHLGTIVLMFENERAQQVPILYSFNSHNESCCLGWW